MWCRLLCIRLHRRRWFGVSCRTVRQFQVFLLALYLGLVGAHTTCVYVHMHAHGQCSSGLLYGVLSDSGGVLRPWLWPNNCILLAFLLPGNNKHQHLAAPVHTVCAATGALSLCRQFCVFLLLHIHCTVVSVADSAAQRLLPHQQAVVSSTTNWCCQAPWHNHVACVWLPCCSCLSGYSFTPCKLRQFSASSAVPVRPATTSLMKQCCALRVMQPGHRSFWQIQWFDAPVYVERWVCLWWGYGCRAVAVMM